MQRIARRSGASIGVATALASAANYATNLVLGRWLGPDAFADAALIVSSLLMLSALAVGIQLSVARALVAGADGAGIRSIRRFAIATGLVMGGLLVAGAPLLAGVFHTRSAMPFVALGCGVPVYFDMAVRRGCLQADGAFSRLALTLVVEAVTRLLTTVALVALGWGATAAAAGLAVSFALSWIVAGRPAVAPARASSGQRSANNSMALLLIGQVLISNGDVLVVSAVLPRDAGVYAAVAMIGRMVYVAAWAVVTVVFPALAAGADDARRVVLRRAFGAIAAIGLVMTGAAALFGRPVLALLLGDGFASGHALLWPYALATSLFSLASLSATADAAAGRATGPGLLAVGGVVQTTGLLALAQGGVSVAVWVQVVVMGLLLIAMVGAGRVHRLSLAWRPAPRISAAMPR